MKKKYYENTHFHVQKRNLICFSWKKIWLGRIKHTKVKWLVPYFVHFNLSFFEISLTFISHKPSDVQLLSTRHVTKVHLLQKFLVPQKHASIDNILPTCGNLSRKMCIHFSPKKINMCVSDRPTHSNIFYANKNNRSAKSRNLSPFPTSTIDAWPLRYWCFLISVSA